MSDSSSPFATLGANVSQVAETLPASVFVPARKAEEEDLNILQLPAYATYLPTGPVIEYARARGILSLSEANQEMLNYIDFLKAELAGEIEPLKKFLGAEVPAFAKENEIDVLSAAGILWATQSLSSPPRADELGRKAIGLDLYVAVQIEFGKSLLDRQPDTTPSA